MIATRSPRATPSASRKFANRDDHSASASFAFSVWIINDQYEKACMSLDADRLRRTFDDGWLFRLLYPAGLLIPWV